MKLRKAAIETATDLSIPPSTSTTTPPAATVGDEKKPNPISATA